MARLKQAPHGAKRLGKHVIEVGWARGKHILKDKPPYQEVHCNVQFQIGVIATISPADDQGRLQAVARLDDGKTQTVTLTQGAAGKWDWLPHISK